MAFNGNPRDADSPGGSQDARGELPDPIPTGAPAGGPQPNPGAGRGFRPSGSASPCPICGRTKDGSCSISDNGEVVLCHQGQAHKPPTDRNGEIVVIAGRRFRCGGVSPDRPDTVIFNLLTEPLRNGGGQGFDSSNGRRAGSKATGTSQPHPAPDPVDPASIRLLRLPGPPDDVVRIDPKGRTYTDRNGIRCRVEAVYGYSKTQRVQRIREEGGDKRFSVQHLPDGAGRWKSSKGASPWPAWRQQEVIDALHSSSGNWPLDAEGERCVEIARQGGAAAVSQPGHAHRPAEIRPRYRALKAAGAAGVIYLADSDTIGAGRAMQAAEAAAAEALPFLLLPAKAVWPEIPVGGSIDDAPGTPAERVAAIEKAVADGKAQPVQIAQEEEPDQAPPTHEDLLARVHARAAELVAQKTPAADRIPLLRACAAEQGLRLTDNELVRAVWKARRAARGAVDAVQPGETLNLAPTPWLWEGLVLCACLSLLVGLPKSGKTSLLVGMIAAWYQGATSYLGQALIGPCPPVLLVGVDMPENDWGRMLRDFGLMGDDARIREPIVGLFHKGRPVTLSPEGVEQIAAYAERHPGLLILLDSYAELIRGLGVAEKDADFAEPISDLMEATAPFGATLVLLHHAGKEKAGGSIAEASRGNTSLPAVSSQNLGLLPVARGADWAQDRRRVLNSDGRGGPTELLVERQGSQWVSHGSPAAVQRAAKLREQEEKLSDRQADALMAVRTRWTERSERSTAKQVADQLGIRGSDPVMSVWRNLCQLERKGFLQKKTTTIDTGKVTEFWPAGESGQEEEGGTGTPRARVLPTTASSASSSSSPLLAVVEVVSASPDSSSSGTEGTGTTGTPGVYPRAREESEDIPPPPVPPSDAPAAADPPASDAPAASPAAPSAPPPSPAAAGPPEPAAADTDPSPPTSMANSPAPSSATTTAADSRIARAIRYAENHPSATYVEIQAAASRAGIEITVEELRAALPGRAAPPAPAPADDTAPSSGPAEEVPAAADPKDRPAQRVRLDDDGRLGVLTGRKDDFGRDEIRLKDGSTVWRSWDQYAVGAA